MRDVISNTSPLIYLYRLDTLAWLPKLFNTVWVPNAVVAELEEGRRRGYDVPNPSTYTWIEIMDPRAVPSEWLTLDLGAGELAVLTLGLDHPNRIVLLDDGIARRVAQAANLPLWGTLKVLLEAKSQGLVHNLGPLITKLQSSGMWISANVRERILALAGEK